MKRRGTDFPSCRMINSAFIIFGKWKISEFCEHMRETWRRIMLLHMRQYTIYRANKNF